MQTAIQLYTVRDLEKPLPDVIHDVAAEGYDGVEFAKRLPDADAGAVRTALDQTGLEPMAAHVDLAEMEEGRGDDLEAVLELADRVGYDDLVVPWLDEEHFESAAAVDDTAERLEAIAERLGAQGYTLHYHNHWQEFVDLGGETAFDHLAHMTERVRFEVDPGWALVAGEDPAELIRSHGDRIDIVHLKDVTAEGEVAGKLGDGVLDLEAIVDAAREIDAAWLVHENDEPDDPAGAPAHGAAVLQDLL